MHGAKVNYRLRPKKKGTRDVLYEQGLTKGKASEGMFVIDDEQRVVEWSDAATDLLAIPYRHALGQRCFALIRGRGPFGRPACQPGCDPFRSLQRGRVRANCSFLIDRAPGIVQRLRCELFALPRLPGGAIAYIQERPEESTIPIPGTAPQPSTAPSSCIVANLAILANLSANLSFFSLTNFEESLSRTLDILRDAVGAESAEIFLAEREGGMLLSAYRGPFKNAFCQITRFPAGQGYPGLVLLRREPILTDSLPDDPRYLRTTVKEKGFRSYICVPLLGPSGIVGSLNLAWRRGDAPLEDALRLLVWASSPISTAIENGLYRLRDAGASVSLETWSAEVDLDQRLREFLRNIIAVGNAAGAVMVLYEPGTGAIMKRIIEGQPPKLVCVAPGLTADHPCPARAEARGIALYGPKESWPPICQRSPAWPTVTYCLPIIVQGHDLGIVQLGYAGRSPSPPTQYLRLLSEMALGAAHLARDVWLRQQSQKLLLATADDAVHLPPRLALPSHSIPDIRSSQAISQPIHQLDIRCFGPFELCREGKPITLDAFGRRAAITLLKILLLNRGRPLSRDHLAETIWPEVDPEAQARRLHVTVHALRQALEPEKATTNWTYILSRGDQYYFNPHAHVRIDLDDFASYIKQAKRLEKEHDHHSAIEAYDAAIALYRGDLFEDEPYAEWCTDERERLRQQYIQAVRRLGALCISLGRPHLSVEYYRRALQVDPLSEDVHRDLMLALWKASRRTDALRQYQLCCEMLRQQLDVEPSTETRRLYELIKQSP